MIPKKITAENYYGKFQSNQMKEVGGCYIPTMNKPSHLLISPNEIISKPPVSILNSNRCHLLREKLYIHCVIQSST